MRISLGSQKRLARYYFIFDNMGAITTDTKTKERIFEYLYDEEQIAEIKEEERKKIKKFKENKK